MKKNFTLLLIVVITTGLVYALIHYVKMDGFAFAWSLNFLLMLCVLMFTEALKSQFTSPYFNQKTWERRGEIYENLGTNYYRKLLVGTGWERLNKKSNPVEKDIKALMNLYYQTKKNELGHVIIFLIVFGFNVFVAFKFGFFKSLWLSVLNVLLNLYPIFLQRYNRPRLERIINLSKRR